jgi:hypothetical protein
LHKAREASDSAVAAFTGFSFATKRLKKEQKQKSTFVPLFLLCLFVAFVA